jgi:AcrR family transcriptional regulator
MAMHSPPELTSESVEHILRAATQLFARHGFHGVTTREIAAAAGLNIATMHYHVGSKRDLYTQVVRRLYEQEHAVIAGFLAQMDETALRQPSTFFTILNNLIDTFIDLMREHPERPQLYVRRWLEWADDPNPEEIESSLALLRLLREMFERAQQAGLVRTDLPIDVVLRSFSWMIYSYFVTGPIDWRQWRGDPHQPEALDTFKRFLHEYIARILAPTAPAVDQSEL